MDEKRSVASAEGKAHHVDDVYADEAVDPVYHAKARIVNDALQEIGMGRYQVCLVEHCTPAVYLSRQRSVVPLHRRRLRVVRVRS
jgi:hypothetical protein